MPTHRTTIFRGMVERQLDDRFNRLIAGKPVDEVSPKMLFYIHLEEFLMIHKGLKEPDIGKRNNPDSHYQYYTAELIPSWCEKKIEEIKKKLKNENKAFEDLNYKNLDRDCLQHWMVLRRQMKIIPTQRGFISGYLGDGYLDVKGSEVRYFGLIIIIGERATLLSKIEQRLSELNYPTVTVSTTGTAVSTVSEIIELLSTINEDRKRGMKIVLFYLHDSDIDGYSNYLNLCNHTQIYSLGINSKFLEYNNLDIKRLKERYVLPTKKSSESQEQYERRLSKSKERTEAQIQQFYNSKISHLVEDLKHYRIDQERVYAMYKLDPFINYFQEIIKEEKVIWDANKVCTLEVDKPTRYYELKERIIRIWEIIENKHAKDWDWNTCSFEKLNNYIKENNDYKGDITKIIEIVKHQKDILQEIIDKDTTNNKILDKIEEEIRKIEEKIS